MKKSAGFTLMELMVVVAIIGIMSAIAIPNVFSWTQNRKFTGTVQRVVSIMNSAKMHAVKENRPTVIIFDKAGNSFRAFVDLSNPPNLEENSGDRLIDEYSIPDGVRILSSTFTSLADGKHQMVINSRGMPAAVNNGRVVIESKRGLSNSIVVASTGRIRVE